MRPFSEWLRVLAFGNPALAIDHGKDVRPIGDAIGRTRTVADPYDGLRPVDLNQDTDLVALAFAGSKIRALYIGTAGLGLLKVDHFDLNGTDIIKGSLIPVADQQLFPAGCITKIYSTANGNTVTNLWIGS